MRGILLIFAGAVLFYAGILTTADSLQVGAGMMIIGGLLIAAPAWQALRRFWSPAKPWPGSAGKSGKRKKKPHLKVVNGNEENDHPTYH